jgi:hypothetical protein
MWSILANVLSRFLPEQRDIIYLSFALADPDRLEGMLADAGFRDIGVEQEKREDVVESCDDYWNPIEAGIGSIPQAYPSRLNYKASGGKKDTRFEIMLDPSHVTSKACDDRFSLHSNGHCERRPVQADWP